MKTKGRKGHASRSPSSISPLDFQTGSPATLARINAAYPYPLYHLQQTLDNHHCPESYLDCFRFPAIQASLAHAFDPAHVAERRARELSAPLHDSPALTGNRVPASALLLAHDPVKQWHLQAASPIAAGARLGYYAGEVSKYGDLGEPDTAPQEHQRARFFQRILDSYPPLKKWAAADRAALAQLKDDIAQGSPYSFLISLPRPGSPPLTLIIDSMKAGNLMRFLSHSTTPNLARIFVRDCRAGTYFLRIEFLARSAIAPGQELTFDYGMEESEMGSYHEMMTWAHQQIVSAVDLGDS